MVKNYPQDFWVPFSDITRLLSNKKKEGRFVFLLFFFYFKHYHNFFKDISILPDDLINKGIELFEPTVSLEDVRSFITKKARLIYKYKNEIRKYFDFKPHSTVSQKKLLTDISPFFYKCSNDEEFKTTIQDHLICEKVEIPASEIILNIIQKVKQREENNLFDRIFQDLSMEDKNWIEQNIISSSNSKDRLCQFLRQDSGPTNAVGIKEEIDRLKTLKKLPLERFNYIKNFPKRHLSLLIRRFLSNTPQQLNRKQESILYGLVVIFFYQKTQATIDNLADHLLNIRLWGVTSNGMKSYSKEAPESCLLASGIAIYR